MSDKIPVTVIITTYDLGDNSRFTLLYQTLQALVDNLIYPNLYWIITDDGSPNHDEMVERVKQIIKSDKLIIFNTERKGVGYAKNNALKEAFKISPIVLLGEDDWELSQPLDLLSYVQVMLDHEDVCMVRFGFLGGDLLARYVSYGYSMDFWEMSRGAGLYAYSGQISLRSEFLYKIIGWHKEFCDPGTEELDMCHKFNNIEHNLKILWPAKYGCTIDSSPLKNIGMGCSLNGVLPEKEGEKNL